MERTSLRVIEDKKSNISMFEFKRQITDMFLGVIVHLFLYSRALRTLLFSSVDLHIYL